MKTKFLARVALVLVLAQTVLILVSWIINAMAPQAAVRSLLSSEGIRWFFGRFVSNLASPLLVWMLLLSVAYGAWRTSGLPEALRAMASPGKLYFRQRFALRLALVILLFSVVVIFYQCSISLSCCINKDTKEKKCCNDAYRISYKC